MIVTGMVIKGSLSHCQDLLGHLDKAGQSLMLFATTVYRENKSQTISIASGWFKSIIHLIHVHMLQYLKYRNKRKELLVAALLGLDLKGILHLR